MKLYVGDKVKFLDAKGGGIVKRVIDSRMVLLTIEGGFEIPTLASELIRVNSEDTSGKFFAGDFTAYQPLTKGTEQENSSGYDEAVDSIPSDIIRNRKSEDVYIGFFPHDQKILITGLIDVYIINNTSADVLYNLYRKNQNDGFSGVDYGSVPEGTKHLVSTIERDDLSQWIEGSIQFLFHKESCKEVPMPFNADYAIQGKKFYSETNYREYRILSGKAIIIRIATLTTPSVNTEENVQKNPLRVSQGDDFIFKHKTAEKEAEVDLHIHELVEDFASIEKSQILEYQKNYFMRCVESALVNHFRKVIFIHGVGNGVLREVLLDYLLKQKGLDVFDPPMKKYGVGALEIRIHHNI